MLKVKRHILGTDPSKDAVLYEEENNAFYVDISITRDKVWSYLNVAVGNVSHSFDLSIPSVAC